MAAPHNEHVADGAGIASAPPTANAGRVATAFQQRQVDWQAFLIAIVVAGALAFAAWLFFDGGATITIGILAFIVAVAPLTSAVLSVRIDDDALVVRQGLSGEGERIPLAGIAATEVVTLSRRERRLRAFAPEGTDIISAGGAGGVALDLRQPRNARFARRRVSRVIVGSPDPGALRAAIDAARGV